VEQTKGIGLGSPPDLKPGAPDAFWVWFDESGWHVRTTAPANVASEFSGRVWTGEGTLSSVKSIRIETEDRVRAAGRAAEFHFLTGGHLDGFDFKITETECVRFKLMYQGKLADTKLIHIGAKQVHPTSATFKLCR
jgi:hypothetical protein